MIKLSVCIPVYNFDVRELVYGLKKEIESYNLPIEIILIDDYSQPSFFSLNSEIQSVVNEFVSLEENIGRSKIRNLFLKYARGEYLLFLDCDAKILSDDFLIRYLNEIENSDLDLIYGGFRIDPQFSHTLRNRYSVAREIFFEDISQDFSVFKTINFVIKKSVFAKFNFNENLTEYGYEDYLFSKILEKEKINFLAVKNPVLHDDRTENSAFLEKLKTGMKSLIRLAEDKMYVEYIRDVKVYKTAVFIERLYLKKVFLLVYSIFENRIMANLLSDHPSIRMLDLYKLCLFLRIK